MFRLRSAPPAPTAPASPEPPGGPAPFDADWYRRHAADAAADPWEDYRSRGTRMARSPCPFFSPAWYRAVYPDVALSGIEPLEHYCTHGWREGRDPSALFSTNALIAQHPDRGETGGDPLAAYLRAGEHRGRPHPRIAGFVPDRPEVAVVMVFVGDRGALDLSLWALERSRGGVPLTLFLVDCGPAEQRADLDRLADERSVEGFRIRRLHERASPFGRLANAGLWAAMQERRFTHIALMEQAVLLPSGLLGGLVDLWAPLAVPVLNVARTDQAVPSGCDIYGTPEPLAAVTAEADRRRAAIPGTVSLSNGVETALALFQASALEIAGLLPEDAGAGPGALDGAIAALAAAGLGRAVVARHLYAHRLERSAALPGVARPASRSAALPQGLAADAASLRAVCASAAADRIGLDVWSAPAATLMERHAARIEAVGQAAERAGARLCERLARAEEDRSRSRPDLSAHLPWDEVVFGDPPRPPSLADTDAFRQGYRALHHRVLAGLVSRDRAHFRTAAAMQPLVALLAEVMAEALPVLVLTMDTDPVTGDEKDGYVQRVIAIDRVLADRPRLYLKLVAARSDRPALVCLDDGLWRLEIAHGCALGEVLLEALLGLGIAVYSQSLVGIDPPVLRRLLPHRTGPFIMDMHGAVPEEFVLYANHYMAQKYDRYERWAAAEADIVVCVTEAMAEHFATKLAIPRARMIVCPIFLGDPDDRWPARSYGERPRAIYAGGTQRWQMIPELAALVADTADAVDWLLLTPDTEGLGRALDKAGVAERAAIALRSASQTEVFATYPRCDFGLLLREDGVVNRVACPTKLIEYLRFGVIPVLRTADVGDFRRLGMRWVTEEDFRRGRLPDPEQRAAMAEANRAVYRRLTETSRTGLARIAGAAAHSLPRESGTPLLRTTA